MFFLLILWAHNYGSYDRNIYASTTYDDDTYLSSKRSDYTNNNSKSEKRYASGTIPEKIQDQLNELFSEETMREILNFPDTIELLRQWRVSQLSIPGRDLSKRKEDAVEDLCISIKGEDPYFCENKRTLIRRIVEDSFYDKETVAINQLFEFVKSTLREENKKLNALQKAAANIKQEEPKMIQRMHADNIRFRQDKYRLNKEIQNLKQKLKQPYNDPEDKSIDEQALSDLYGDRQLLSDATKHAQHDLNKQTQEFEKIKKQKSALKDDIKKIEDMPEEISIVLKKRKNSTDLKRAWNEINQYFSKHEKDKEKDRILKEEELRKKKDETAKENVATQNAQEQEIQFMQALRGNSSDPETAKDSANLLSSISKFINNGG